MSKSTCSIETCGAKVYVRGYCRPHYRRLMKYGDPLGAPEPISYASHNSCSVDGCGKLARSRIETLCPMHYHRNYRHGSVDAKPQSVKTGTPRKYKTVQSAGHPLADKQGRVYEHRFVLYESIGGGAHSCGWCSRAIDWSIPKGDEQSLTVDHINEDKGDNRLSNLTASCISCNVSRSMARRSRELRSAGAWSARDTIASLVGGRPVNRFSQEAS